MKKILILSISFLLCNVSSGQLSIAPHAGIFNNSNKIINDTGGNARASTTPTLTYGLGIGYAFERMIVELDISNVQLETGISFVAPGVPVPLELVLGQGPNNLNTGFTRFGINFKYNLLKNNETFQVTPFIGGAIVQASGYQAGLHSSGSGSSSSDGKIASADFYETSYSGNTIVQFAVGGELAVKLSDNFYAYVSGLYNISTSDQFTTEARYEIGTDALKNLTSEAILDNPNLLSESATSVSKFTGFQTSLGVRYTFSFEKKPTKI